MIRAVEYGRRRIRDMVFLLNADFLFVKEMLYDYALPKTSGEAEDADDQYDEQVTQFLIQPDKLSEFS